MLEDVVARLVGGVSWIMVENSGVNNNACCLRVGLYICLFACLKQEPAGV